MSGGKVQFTSRAGEAKILLYELERAALKAVAKLVRKDAKARVKQQSERTGNLRRCIGTRVRRKGPEGPSLQLGVFSRAQAKRKGLQDPYYAWWIEAGTANMRARPFLRPAVEQNIDEIRRLQGQYLKHIEDENRARGLVDAREEVAEDP